MTRRLIVHIGMPRAGSSTLQEILYTFRSRLEPQGLLYPVLDEQQAGGGRRTQVYNHKLLQQSARAFWPPGRFANFHGDIARQIAASPAPIAVLSYEGWWEPGSFPALRKTVTHIERHCPGIETTIAAIVREPASFLLSLYKLDVLHGRTDATFAEYWPANLSEPRLRYGKIAAKLRSDFRNTQFLEFESLSQDGRLVANVLAAFGAGDILTRAGVPGQERHRSKGGGLFDDAPVSMMLFAARQLGLKRLRARREDITAMILKLAASKDLAPDCEALSIPLGPEACRAITDATRRETGDFTRITGVALPEPQPKGPDGGQSVITAESPLATALLEALGPMR